MVAAVFITAALTHCINHLHKPENVPGIRVSFIDVGQGDAILVQSGVCSMLIDCGEEESASDVIHTLKSRHIRHLDYVLGTHPHSDHMGAMARVLNAFETDEILVSPVPEELVPEDAFYLDMLETARKKGIPITQVSAGQSFDIGSAKVEILAPVVDGDDLNNCSVCTLITLGEVSFLLTGDAETDEEQSMLDSGVLSGVSVYKAGHHGSKTSSGEDFLKAIHPDAAVISCGVGNSFAHPRDETISRLMKYTDNIFRTDLCGTITIESDGSTFAVRTERSVYDN